MTTTTTKHFQWVDRDTAARDLLQLVYHAPESMSLKAMRLLETVRSPAIISELQAIVMDDDRDIWERRYALRAIDAASENLYMPELQRLLDIQGITGEVMGGFGDDAFFFAAKHPSNRTWLFEYVERYPPEIQRDRLCHYCLFYYGISDMKQVICDRLIAIIEAHPALLDLRAVDTLYFADARASTRDWLAARWQTLVYLCLSTETQEILYLLERWDELRNVVFYCCPMLVLEYHPLRAQLIAERKARCKRKAVDLTQSTIWREMAALHAQASEGDRDALDSIINHTRSRDVLTRATAVHFLGKLPLTSQYLQKVIRLLHYNDLWQWQSPYIKPLTNLHPVLFEAGEVLRDYPSPEAWRELVDTYFAMNFDNDHQNFMCDWIAYQTDVLSGLDAPYTGRIWKAGYRPWFQVLAEGAEA